MQDSRTRGIHCISPVWRRTPELHAAMKGGAPMFTSRDQSFRVFSPGAVFWLLIVVLISVCLQGPNYERPILDVPRNWDQTAAGGSNAGVPVITEGLPETSWWQAF